MCAAETAEGPWHRARTFPSPDAAALAAVATLASLDMPAFLAAAGLGGPRDDDIWQALLADMRATRRVVHEPGGEASLHLGSRAWRFPAPVTRADGGWRFDCAAARAAMFRPQGTARRAAPRS
jgi:hypothetical protein